MNDRTDAIDTDTATDTATTTATGAPRPDAELSLRAPIDRWDEAIPIGSGRLGALLWGGDHVLRVSLDRADLWDRRPVAAFDAPTFNWRGMRAAVAAGDHEFLRNQFERPYRDSPHPTKLPAGRLYLEFEPDQHVDCFTLNLREAVATAHLTGGQVSVFGDAVRGRLMIRLRGIDARLRIALPPFAEHEAPDASDRRALQRLGYEAGTCGADDMFTWAHQPCAEGASYAIVAARSRPAADESLIALDVTLGDTETDPVATARASLAETLALGFDGALEAHVEWWRAFWERSGVRTGDDSIDRHYHLVRYLGGAASRRGAPPMALQGIWTADEGKIPPWKGDYHHDLNSQLCYWPYLAMDDLEQGASFLDWLWDLLPAAQRFARSFYDTEGACLPATCGIDGQPMGGWHQYSFSPTCSAWLAHAFVRHWRYTMDHEFLADRAWPFCQQIAQCLHELLEPDESGTLSLPLSSSPEIHDNRPEAWFSANTNFDVALLRWLFGAMVEMSEALGEHDEARHWRDVLARLPALAVGEAVPNGAPGPVLHVAPEESLAQSHRHPSHMMAIHPLGLIHVEAEPDQRSLVRNTVRQLDFLGTAYWTGYTFTWGACIAARAGLAERALAMLEMYLKITVSRNGFHLNGDYRQLGLLAAQYRPFTLEGNFAAAEAVHEMLLQSWGGVIRVFPATPDAWPEASFASLRAEGAFRVSAARRAGLTQHVRIVAERDGPVRLRDPFPGRPASWSRDDIERCGDELVCELCAGDMLEGTARS